MTPQSPPSRPTMIPHTRSGSFRTRALAVSAAHRIATDPHSHHGSPSSTASGPIAVNEHGQGHDVEAAMTSPSSSTTPLSPTSPVIGTAGIRHRRRSHHRHKGQQRWLTNPAGGGTGDEPGVDVKSKRDEEAYGHLRAKTKVTVVDYSSNPAEDGTNLKCDFPGERLREWLDSDVGERRTGDDGKPLGVRWIHIDGLNWEVIKTLVLHYGLHPLAVEDSLRATNTPRSKMDFYRNHLYLQILIHHTTPADEDQLLMVADELAGGGGHVASDDGQGSVIDDCGSSIIGAPKRTGLGGKLARAFKGERRVASLPKGVQGVFEPSVVLPRHAGGPQTFEKEAHTITVNELSAKYMVPIRRGILSVFMLRDGTLISMDSRPTREVLAPIYARLDDEQSLLRRSGDVSMLAEAILDVAVDLAIEIAQTFEAEILKLEASVLVDPQMETVRHLHILSSQLIRLRRSLTPLLHVCYIIRDQDMQRAVAASAMVPPSRDRSPAGSAIGQMQHGLTPMHGQHGPNHPGMAHPTPSALGLGTGMSPAPSRPGTPGPGKDAEAALQLFGLTPSQAAGVGFFSPMTKVYIGDVIDHLEIIVGSMEQFVSTCEHLTDYVFNVLSFQTNESMERLSIVTVLFLPLTFIASYFGMNFEGFDALKEDVSYFWKIAAPCTVAFFVIFSFSYLRSFAETLYRRVMRYRRLQGMGGGDEAKEHRREGKGVALVS